MWCELITVLMIKVNIPGKLSRILPSQSDISRQGYVYLPKETTVMSDAQLHLNHPIKLLVIKS